MICIRLKRVVLKKVFLQISNIFINFSIETKILLVLTNHRQKAMIKRGQVCKNDKLFVSRITSITIRLDISQNNRFRQISL